MQTIRQTYSIHASVARVWQALTDPNVIKEWSGTPAKMDDQVGTKFSLWGGDMHGTNTEVVPEKKLVQDWFAEDWKEPSSVTFTLSEDNGVTTVQLLHENVPDDVAENYDQGWKDSYLGPLKELVESDS